MLSLLFLGALAFQAVVYAEDDKSFALKYLNQYHYISPTRSGNHDVETALKNFQRIAGLPVTGEIDEATVRQMKEPRCGMADDSASSRFKRYATRGKWSKNHLKYYIQHGADLSQDTQNKVFAKALKYWADVSGLSFSRTMNVREADLKISFGARSHGGTSVERTCGSPFDGRGRVLAHAYYPSDGRAHFDEDETYTDNTSSGTNLLWVATHEFGHSLGLAHSDVRGAIMYPYYTGYVANMKLHSDDIQGIQSLYGANSGGGSSGSCVDKNRNCPNWKRYCGYHSYVKSNCKKTCKLC